MVVVVEVVVVVMVVVDAFLLPSRQCQSTEEKSKHCRHSGKITYWT